MFNLHLRVLVLAATLIAAAPAFAIEPQRGWLVGFYVLDSDLELKPGYSFTLPESNDTYHSVQVGTGFGYLFDSGFSTEVKFNFGSFEIFGDLFGLDTYYLSEVHLVGAYDFYLNDRFSIGPELRYTRAKLQAEEGEFLNPGPEDTYSVYDYAFTWGARLKWRVSDRFTMALLHHRADYDFGDAHSTGLHFQWHWN